MSTAIDRNVTQALARVHYAIEANARWQSVQIAKSFQAARRKLLTGNIAHAGGGGGFPVNPSEYVHLGKPVIMCMGGGGGGHGSVEFHNVVNGGLQFSIKGGDGGPKTTSVVPVTVADTGVIGHGGGAA